MLRVVYPLEGHQTNESSTFLMGSVTLPDCRLTIKGVRVAVSDKGFFSHRVPLSFGENALECVAMSAAGYLNSESSPEVETLMLKVFRNEPLPARHSPVICVEMMQPQTSLVLMAGQTLRLACAVNAENVQRVEVDIPGVLVEPLALHSAQTLNGFVDNRDGVFGELHQMRPLIFAHSYYQANVVIPQGTIVSNAEIRLTVTYKEEQSEQAVEKQCSEVFPGGLTCWTQPRAAVLRAASHETKGSLSSAIVMRVGPSNAFARLTPQSAGTPVLVTVKENGWCCVQLSQSEVGWIADENICFDLENVTSALPLVTLRQMHVMSTGRRGELTIPFQRQVPFQVHECEKGLEILFYGVRSQCDVVCYDGVSDSVIVDAFCKQRTAGVVSVSVDCPSLAGYEFGYRDDASTFFITVKSKPVSISDCSVLIDPGHGGDELGSVGLDGQPEKALNLSLSLLLKAELEAAGFSPVRLTRDSDMACSLIERQDWARLEEADITLSLHHNALPDGRDPSQHSGLSTFYYHPMSRSLATHLQLALPEALSLNSYGLFYDNLAMTRIHTGVSVLLELGFFTNPTDYERLIEPEFQQCAATELMKALKAYVEKD